MLEIGPNLTNVIKDLIDGLVIIAIVWIGLR